MSAAKLKLWFFKLNFEQRRNLYSIFGMPVDDIRTHGDEGHCFKHILSTLKPEGEQISGEAVDEEALDKAAREGYAVRCKTNGPRVLAQYASGDIMQRQLDDARVIVAAYLETALGGRHE